MEYLKFNCHDLAEQNIELFNVYSKIQQLSNEFDSIVNSLDPQIKSYADLQKQFITCQSVIADIVTQFSSSYNTLDQIIDLYYLAERKVMQASEDLPVGIPFGTSSKNSTRILSHAPMPQVTTASINGSGIILEDWLAELIYRSGNDDNKE